MNYIMFGSLILVTTIDFIFCITIVVVIIWGWRDKLGVSLILGWSAIISLVGFILALILPSENPYEQLILAYLPLPGLFLSLAAVIAGIVTYRKTKMENALWGIAMGLVTMLVLSVLFVTPAGGLPFLCSNNYGCSALKNKSQCVYYSNFMGFFPDQIGSIHPGLCIQQAAGLQPIDNGPGSRNVQVIP